MYIVPYDPSVLTSADVRSQRGSNVMQELPRKGRRVLDLRMTA